MEMLHIGSIDIQLNRKSIKNLHINVLPPDGRVRVSAPQSMSDNAIRTAVINRIPWIKKQQAHFKSQPRQSIREMVTGECHYLWGKKYRLDIVKDTTKKGVEVKQSKIKLYTENDELLSTKLKKLEKFYRNALKEQVHSYIDYWSKILGVNVSSWIVRKMKTKWGSCNTDRKSITINLELVKKPPECLEFIVVHELVHLLERHHNDKFRTMMDRYLPDWQERRELLNSMPLAHDSWDY